MTPTSSQPLSEPNLIRDVACTICGCVCDDLVIETDGERVVRLEGACELARPFLERQRALLERRCWIEGREATWPEAIKRAQALLQRSRAPLIYGLSRSSTEGQRVAVRLADRLGAVIDTTASRCHAPSIVALQQVGESTCTLGEARHHCDLVIFWGSNPALSHPRHGERYSLDPPGMFLGGGREQRHVVAVDVCETETTELADETLLIPPGTDFDVLWTLRALVQGVPVEAAPAGVSLDRLRALAERCRNCRSGIVFFGLGLTRHGVPHRNVEALLRWVTDLNAVTRFYARRMRIPGDVAGADSVLCWQTGYPFSVNLSRGYPRYNPGEYSANELLERGEVDCVLLVGSEGVARLSETARRQVEQLPTIVLDYPTQTCPFPPTVAFQTSVYGVHLPGTAYRMDETPIPLRPFLPSQAPSHADVLRALFPDSHEGRAAPPER